MSISGGFASKSRNTHVKSHALNARLNSFYASEIVPEHLRNLLEVYGIFEVEHLLKFDEETVVKIERAIQNGTFARGYIDMSSKQEQMRYFGAWIVDAGSFGFRMAEVDILCSLSKLASEFIKGESKGESVEKTKKIAQKRPYSKRLGFEARGATHSSNSSDDNNLSLQRYG